MLQGTLGKCPSNGNRVVSDAASCLELHLLVQTDVAVLQDAAVGVILEKDYFTFFIKSSLVILIFCFSFLKDKLRLSIIRM